jgi:hypothetical protein
VRAVVQSGLAADLGDVRVHTGPRAETLLDQIGGDAATIGHHIAMRPEASHASTLPGRVLLLHELMHVAQQSGRPAATARTDDADRQEHEAHRAAMTLATTPPMPLPQAMPLGQPAPVPAAALGE